MFCEYGTDCLTLSFIETMSMHDNGNLNSAVPVCLQQTPHPNVMCLLDGPVTGLRSNGGLEAVCLRTSHDIA